MTAAPVEGPVPAAEAVEWPTGLPAAPEPPSLAEAPGFAAADPREYQLPALDEVTAEAVEADGAARSLMAAAGLPAEIGSFVAQRVAALDDPSGGVDDAAYFMRWSGVRENLHRVMGAEAFRHRMSALRELVADTDRRTAGAATRFLDEHAGVLLDPMVVSQLLLHAERWREGRRR
jgi:hypothetical protein